MTWLKTATPLSVSADKIAMAAWRCCRLLMRLADARTDVFTDALGLPFANDGRRRIVEACPAAALSLWGIPRDDYEKPARRDRRETMLARLERASAHDWLSWSSDTTRANCLATDHAHERSRLRTRGTNCRARSRQAVPERDRGVAGQEG